MEYKGNVFEIEGKQGKWEAHFAPPVVGATIELKNGNQETKVTKLLVDDDQLKVVTEAFPDIALPHQAYSIKDANPADQHEFETVHIIRGSFTGPGGISVPEECKESLGGYGNYDPSVKLCVSCPLVRQCFCRATETPPSMTINNKKKKATRKSGGGGKKMPTTNPANPFTRRGKVVFEAVLAICKENAEHDEIKIHSDKIEAKATELGLESKDPRNTVWKALIKISTNDEWSKLHDEGCKEYKGLATYERLDPDDSHPKYNQSWLLKAKKISQIAEGLEKASQ